MPEADGHTAETDAQEAILEAAHEVFIRHGTAGARMREIAEAAGVNQALLHYYFRSKEGLARAVFVRAARQLMPAVIEAVGSPLPLEEKVERVVATEMSVLSEHPYLPGYVLCELAHHPERVNQLVQAALGEGHERAGLDALAVLRSQLEEAETEGRVRALSAESFVVNLLAMAIFPFAARPLLEIMLGLDGDAYEAFLDRRRKELSGFFLRGLRP